MEQTPTTSATELMEEAKAERRYTVAVPRRNGYKVHPLDVLIDSRMKVVRTKNEDGTTTSSRRFVPYKKPRYERYVGFVNLGNTYPFGSTRQGF